MSRWTSGRHHRTGATSTSIYSIHGADSTFWNLGLIRAKGSITAAKTWEIVKAKLESFGIQFDEMTSHVVAATTDGASVMLAFGDQIPAQHVACYAHALHLAVQDVFYKPEGAANIAVVTEDDHIYA